MSMLTELRNRGVQDALVVCCDGLKGLPDALRVTWPQATVQACVVHLVRNGLRYASTKHLGQTTRQLKAIYTTATVQAVEGAVRRVQRGMETGSGDDRELGEPPGRTQSHDARAATTW